MARTKREPAALANVGAERNFLGALLRSPQAFWTIQDRVRADQFTVDIHRDIFTVVHDLSYENKVVAYPTVVNRLPEEFGESEDTRAYVSVLVHDTEGLDCGDFVDLIVDAAGRRHLLRISEALTKGAMATDRPSLDYAAEAESELLDMMSNTAPRRPKSLYELAQNVRAEAVASNTTDLRPGMDTGLPSLDAIMGLIMPGDFGAILAAQGDGKGQPLDAPILTPYGFRPMGNLRIGSPICAPDGSHGHVIGVYPLGERQLYNVRFHDGTSTEVTEDHIWLAWQWGAKTREMTGERGARLYTTAQMMATAKTGKGRPRFRIPAARPLAFNAYRKTNLPIPPYVLGVLLGDGSLNRGTPVLTCEDQEIVDRCSALLGGKIDRVKAKNRAATFSLKMDSGVPQGLKKLGLAGHMAASKFVPRCYAEGLMDTRWEVLRGLMDTDGWVNVNGDPRFLSVSKQLADDVAFIARSLGAVVTRREKPSWYRKAGKRHDCQLAHELRLKFRDGADAFHLTRKKAKCNKPQSLYRIIESIESTRIAPAQCIKVSHPSSLYLTNDFIVTHNTALGAAMGIRGAQLGKPTLMIELEMTGEQIAAREMAKRSGITVREIREGRFSFDGLERIKESEASLEGLNYFVLDDSRMTLKTIRARAIAFKRSFGLGLLIVDHFRLIGADGRPKDRWEKHEINSGGLKALAKELGISVLALVQRTRTAQRRDDPTPQIDDADAPSIEQDADWIIGLWRKHTWLARNKPNARATAEDWERWKFELQHCRRIASAITLKARSAEAGKTAELGWIGQTTSFCEIADLQQVDDDAVW